MGNWEKDQRRWFCGGGESGGEERRCYIDREERERRLWLKMSRGRFRGVGLKTLYC